MFKDNTCFFFDISNMGKVGSAESLEKGMLEFYREDISRSGKHYSLGLSFAKKVAALHGGFVEISAK